MCKKGCIHTYGSITALQILYHSVNAETVHFTWSGNIGSAPFYSPRGKPQRDETQFLTRVLKVQTKTCFKFCVQTRF